MAGRSRTPASGQLPLLPIEAAPPKVRRYGLRDAHSYPLVSLGKRPGQPFRSFRVPAARAWSFPALELRTGNSWPALILDCDYDCLEAVLSQADYCMGDTIVAPGRIPQPNWIVLRRENGHGHLVWCLARPVHRPCRGRAHVKRRPLLVWAKVTEYFTAVVQADVGYEHVLTHNPMSRGHGPDFGTRWLQKRPYTLATLRAYLPPGYRLPSLPQTAPGRNCAVFEGCMKWAGSQKHLGLPVRPVAQLLNAQLAQAGLASKEGETGPLSESEIDGIARSVERYRKQWIAQGRFYDHDPQIQRARGMASGRARRAPHQQRDRQIVALAAAGWSQRAIARELQARGQHCTRDIVRHVLTRPFLGGGG